MQSLNEPIGEFSYGFLIVTSHIYAIDTLKNPRDRQYSGVARVTE